MPEAKIVALNFHQTETVGAAVGCGHARIVALDCFIMLSAADALDDVGGMFHRKRIIKAAEARIDMIVAGKNNINIAVIEKRRPSFSYQPVAIITFFI